MIDRLIDISNTALLGLFGLWALYFLKVYSNEGPRQLRLWTGILMLVLAAQTLLWLVCSFVVPDYVEDTGASVTVGLLAAPFTVFVMMELTRLCHVTSRRVLKHVLVPLVLALVYIAQLLCNVLSADSSQGQWRNITLLIYCIWMGCYIVYYICRFTVATRHYEQVVGDIYADVEGRTINWLKWIFGILLAVVAMFVVLIVLVEARWTLIAYNVVDAIFWLALCHNISLMRDNEAIETLEELQVITKPEPVPSPVEVQQTSQEDP